MKREKLAAREKNLLVITSREFVLYVALREDIAFSHFNIFGVSCVQGLPLYDIS